MTNRPPRKFIVFWLAHFVGNPANRGWDTKLVHPRYKDFDDEDKANACIEKLRQCEKDDTPYQSRYVTHVTAGWTIDLKD
jgi:hypothetical protein